MPRQPKTALAKKSLTPVDASAQSSAVPKSPRTRNRTSPAASRPGDAGKRETLDPKPVASTSQDRGPKAKPPTGIGNAARALEVVYQPLADLVPYAKNPRTHGELQVAAIANSITEFGFTNPILVDEKRVIIAGHGRLMAAQKLGLSQVPTITLAGLTAAQRKALVIADNRLALGSGWDMDLLRSELGDLRGWGFDLSLTGFSDLEITDIFAEKRGLTDADDVPPLEEKPVTRAGEIWLLGPHRIVCGDSTDKATVLELFAGQKPHLMVTDPPYGVDYDPNWRNERARTSKGMGNRGIGAGAVGKVSNDDRADWSPAFSLFPGDVIYAWHADLRAMDAWSAIARAGFEMRAQIIWVKSNIVIGRGHYHFQHEPCWYAVRKGATGHWQGSRKETTRWDIDKPQKSETGHSTQKPVECMARPIRNNSAPGEIAYDPFLGSGTTIIAAEMEGRVAFGCELQPNYVDLSVRRWQQFTGRKATLSGTKKTFDQITGERAGAR